MERVKQAHCPAFVAGRIEHNALVYMYTFRI